MNQRAAKTKKSAVVIVDDNAGEALLAEGIIAELQPAVSVQILSCHDDLFAYLEGLGLYQNRTHYPYPALILLTVGISKIDGLAVLEWLNRHPEHTPIPVVVLSGSVDMARRVTMAYQLGAQSFLPKPLQQRDVEDVLSLLDISV